MQAVSRFIERDDGPDLHVVEAGPTDAPSILFVHGYSQCCLAWREQFASDLADEFHLVAVDLRGHGRSEKPQDGYSDADSWASDVAAVVDDLGPEPVVLVGWSYGSLVTLDYLATHGTDQVAGANLVGVVAGIGTEQTNAWLGDDYVDLFPAIVSTDAETSTAALDRLVDLCVEGDLSMADRYLLLGASVVVPPHVRDGMRDRTVSYLDFLDDLRLPVLLSHGVHDAVVSVDAAREVDRLLAAATRSEYDDDGHSPFWESPDRFNRELRSFVDDVSGAAVGSAE